MRQDCNLQQGTIYCVAKDRNKYSIGDAIRTEDTVEKISAERESMKRYTCSDL